MGFLEAVKSWKSRKSKSDLHKVRITSNGAFYMNSEDLFKDKVEALKLLDKLNESMEMREKSSVTF